MLIHKNIPLHFGRFRFPLIGNFHGLALGGIDLLRFAEGRDDAVERGAELVRVFRFQRGAEDLQLFLQLSGGDERLMLDIDLVVRRLFCVIARDEQLLIELFARAQTCFDNIDIDIGFIAGKADQVAG